MEGAAHTLRFCGRCGEALPPGFGICPVCAAREAEAVSAMGRRRGMAGTCLPVEELWTWFPDLEIVGLIGAGGMGAVYKAYQPRLDRFAALKVLSCGRVDDGFALRFEREARAMARLNHPNIASVYAFGEIDRSPVGQAPLFYLLMEHVDGPDLHSVIDAGGYTCGEALKWVGQICEGLQFAHDEGVTHRDITPGNLLLDRTGRPKIVDFGLAKLRDGDGPFADRLTVTGMAMGTPRYIAPEQWEAPGAADHRSDIFSLGAVLYELLMKEPAAGLSSRLPEKCRIDPRIDGIVSKAMERNPDRRYQKASEISGELARIAGSGAGRPGWRRILGWTLLAAGMVSALGLAAARWAAGPEDKEAEVWRRAAVAGLAAGQGPMPEARDDGPFSREWMIGTQWTFNEIFGDQGLRLTHFRDGEMDIYAFEEPGTWRKINGVWRWDVVDEVSRTIRIYWYSGEEVAQITADLRQIRGSKADWKRAGEWRRRG